MLCEDITEKPHLACWLPEGFPEEVTLELSFEVQVGANLGKSGGWKRVSHRGKSLYRDLVVLVVGSLAHLKTSKARMQCGDSLG